MCAPLLASLLLAVPQADDLAALPLLDSPLAAPDAACVGLDDLRSGAALLRSVRPEARLVLDGVAFDVGGLSGQPNHLFLRPEWLDGLTADEAAFRFVGFALGAPQERLAWARVRHAAPEHAARLATWAERDGG